jgi:hypothetical protein
MAKKDKATDEKEPSFLDKVFAKYPANHSVSFAKLREVLETVEAGPKSLTNGDDEESDAQPD